MYVFDETYIKMMIWISVNPNESFNSNFISNWECHFSGSVFIMTFASETTNTECLKRGTDTKEKGKHADLNLWLNSAYPQLHKINTIAVNVHEVLKCVDDDTVY